MIVQVNVKRGNLEQTYENNYGKRYEKKYRELEKVT